MPAFSTPKVGGWSYGEVLTSAQMNSINSDLPFALNCRDGASYTPSGTINIQTPTTKTVVLNGCTLESTADGGALVCGQIEGATVTCDTITSTGSLDIDTIAGEVVAINGTQFAAAANGSHITTTGSVGGRRVVVDVTGGAGAGTGTHLFSYLIQHIAVRSGVSAGCIWQIQSNPATGDTSNQWLMRFVNFTSTVITVRDPAVATLTTLVATTGNQFAATFAWNGSAWAKIDAAFWP